MRRVNAKPDSGPVGVSRGSSRRCATVSASISASSSPARSRRRRCRGRGTTSSRPSRRIVAVALDLVLVLDEVAVGLQVVAALDVDREAIADADQRLVHGRQRAAVALDLHLVADGELLLLDLGDLVAARGPRARRSRGRAAPCRRPCRRARPARPRSRSRRRSRRASRASGSGGLRVRHYLCVGVPWCVQRYTRRTRRTRIRSGAAPGSSVPGSSPSGPRPMSHPAPRAGRFGTWGRRLRRRFSSRSSFRALLAWGFSPCRLRARELGPLPRLEGRDDDRSRRARTGGGEGRSGCSAVCTTSRSRATSRAGR